MNPRVTNEERYSQRPNVKRTTLRMTVRKQRGRRRGHRRETDSTSKGEKRSKFVKNQKKYKEYERWVP